MELTGHPTSPVHILDLGFVVPLMVVSGLWLRQGKPWGYVAAPIMLLKGVMVGLGLLAANLMAVLDDGRGDGPLNALWAVIVVGSAVVLIVFLRHVDARPDSEHPVQAAGDRIQSTPARPGWRRTPQTPGSVGP